MQPRDPDIGQTRDPTARPRAFTDRILAYESRIEALERKIRGRLWVDFSSSLVWSSSGTQPSLGNGLKNAQYRLDGDLCYYQGAFSFGSTSTAGTGTYSINLPFPAHYGGAGMAAGEPYLGVAKYYRISAGVDVPGVMQIFAGSVVNFPMSSPAAGAAPAPWSATFVSIVDGANMCWTIQYRIA